jgi:hypothetical protein
MAKNTGPNHRKGAIRSESQIMNPTTGHWVKFEGRAHRAHRAFDILKDDMTKNKPPKVITWQPTLEKAEDLEPDVN